MPDGGDKRVDPALKRDDMSKMRCLYLEKGADLGVSPIGTDGGLMPFSQYKVLVDKAVKQQINALPEHHRDELNSYYAGSDCPGRV